MKTIKQVLLEKKGEKAHKQAVEMGLKYKGFGYWVDPSSGQVTHKTQNDELVPVDPDVESEKAGKDKDGAAEKAGPLGGGLPGMSFNNFKGKDDKEQPKPDGSGIGTAKPGEELSPKNNANWEPGPDGSNFVKDQSLQTHNEIPKDTFVGKTNYYNWTAGPDGDNYQTLSFRDIINRAQGIRENIETSPQRIINKAFSGTEKSQVDAVNNSLSQLVEDKNYDMNSAMKDGEMLGQGAFGEVYASKDGNNVIKKGTISRPEIMNLARLRDNPAFPNLINAKIDDNFAAEADDPEWDENSTFWEENPVAQGTVAMSRMPGQTFANARYDMDEEQTQKFIQKLWFARAGMHKMGISHNDMHGDNIFVGEDGSPGIIDMGLSSDDPLSALMEGLGGFSGKDYQLDSAAKPKNSDKEDDDPFGSSFSFVPEALKDKIKENVGGVREMLMDRIAETIDEDDEEGFDNATFPVEDMIQGGLRIPKRKLQELKDQIPVLQDKDFVGKLINRFYDNVSDTETGQRMSNAFDKLQKDRRQVALANMMRQRKGQPEIEDRLAKVLDPDS